MTWIIDEVTLPFGGPTSVEWGILRKQQAQKIVDNFPFPVDIGPDAMELTITGKIQSGKEIKKLREIVKRAETESIQLQVDDAEFDMYDSDDSGLYAISKAKIGQKGPSFDAATGQIVQDYNISLVQFAAGGLASDGLTGDKNLDEDGVGFGDLDSIFEDILIDQFPNIYDLIMG